MEYLAGGYTMISDIYGLDGTVRMNDAGGSAYAVGGMRLWRDSVGYVGTAGKDFDEFFGRFYRDNGIALFMEFPLEETLHYDLHYAADGSWTESCLKGEEYENEARATGALTVEMFSKGIDRDTKGVYLEAAMNTDIVHRFRELKCAIGNARLMWEIEAGDLYEPSLKDEILRLIPQADCFSINMNEGKAFFDTSDEKEVMKSIDRIGKPCFLRAGEAGACWIEEGRGVFVPSYGADTSVDSTGCGNASTAAALIGFAEGFSPSKTVAMANISAYYNSRCHGLYPLYDMSTRIQAEKESLSLMELSREFRVSDL